MPFGLQDKVKRLVEIARHHVKVSRANAAFNPGGVDFDTEKSGAIHGRGQRLGPTHAAEAAGDDQPAGQAAPEVPARAGGERLVSSLQDALGADVNPTTG